MNDRNLNDTSFTLIFVIISNMLREWSESKCPRRKLVIKYSVTDDECSLQINI